MYRVKKTQELRKDVTERGLSLGPLSNVNQERAGVFRTVWCRLAAVPRVSSCVPPTAAATPDDSMYKPCLIPWPAPRRDEFMKLYIQLYAGSTNPSQQQTHRKREADVICCQD